MPTGQVADELVRQGVISGLAGPPVAPSVPPELVRSDGSWFEPPDLVQTGSGYPTEPTFTMPQQLNPKPSEQRRVCPILIWSWSPLWRDRSALASGDFPVRNLRFPEDLTARASQTRASKPAP